VTCLINNRQWVIRSRNFGATPLRECFELVTTPVPALEPGQVLLRNRAFGIEPGMTAWLRNMAPYMAPVELGEPMRCWNVAEVVATRNPRYQIGQRVHGVFDWQEYCVCGDFDHNNTRPLTVPEGASDEAAAGLLWVSGVTAYIGLMEYGRPQLGDTVLISAAAGAVGSTVGQLAKLAGARVVGLAGSREKCEWLVREVGFDAALNYKDGDLDAQLRALCPAGIDVYWDTVGGQQLNLVLGQMAVRGRIVQLGALSLAKGFDVMPTLTNWLAPVHKRLSWQGFLVTDHWQKFEPTIERLHHLLQAGKLKLFVDAVHGFEQLPVALEGLLSGQNFGKKVVLVD